MTYEVLFTQNAVDDEAVILEYLVHQLCSPDAARHFIDGLDALVRSLEHMPLAFPVSTEPRLTLLGYRKAPVMNYIVLYKVEDNKVFISHIFHQSQDYARLV